MKQMDPGCRVQKSIFNGKVQQKNKNKCRSLKKVKTEKQVAHGGKHQKLARMQKTGAQETSQYKKAQETKHRRIKAGTDIKTKNRPGQREAERLIYTHREGRGNWTQVEHMTTGADNHRDRKGRKHTRNRAYKIKQETENMRHQNNSDKHKYKEVQETRGNK